MRVSINNNYVDLLANKYDIGPESRSLEVKENVELQVPSPPAVAPSILAQANSRHPAK